MLEIEKDGMRTKVSRKAFEDNFSRFGWKVAGAEKKECYDSYEKLSQLPSFDPDCTDDDDENEVVSEDEQEDNTAEYNYLYDKPVEEMDSKELRIFAKMLDVYEDGMSKKDAKKAVLKATGK